MKNYVAKLRENEEKGFSLVELIIVMAIMAMCSCITGYSLHGEISSV